MKDLDQLKLELESIVVAGMAERVFEKMLEDYTRVACGTLPAQRDKFWEVLANQINETHGTDYVTLRQDSRIFVFEISQLRILTAYRDNAMALKVSVCQGITRSVFDTIYDMFTNAIAMVHLKGMMANVRKEADLHRKATMQSHPFYGMQLNQQPPSR